MEQHRKTATVTIAGVVATMTLLMSPAQAQLTFVPGDVNGDGIVNAQDISWVASNWGIAVYTDQDGVVSDGIVNSQDIALIASHWDQTGPTQAQVIASLPTPPASAYTSGYNASILQQVGLTQAVAASANYGAGVTIGIIDTGILADSPDFYGRISPSSECIISAVMPCGAGYGIEDTPVYHGTVVASVAAGANPLQIGVAPKAMIDVVKGIYEYGGIPAAVAGGANVINISQAGALTDVADINYAASKGATIVIAAGNSSNPYFDWLSTSFGGIYEKYGSYTYQGRQYSYYQGGEYGFTQQALSHIIVVGGVTSSNVVESFSNIPGSDFIGTTGSQTLVYLNPNPAYAIPEIMVNNSTGPIATLQSIWLMAPDTVPNVGSATSYAAPMVAGAAALLDARWPILIQNGTTAAVLFASATPLGDPSIYGNGLLNLQAAFQPIGGVSVLAANGSSISVNQLVGGIQASGPLGGMNILQAALTNYTVFDSFQRNFKENLAYLISHPSTSSSVEQAATAPKPTVSSTKFADGSSLSFGTMDNVSNGVDHPAGTVGNPNWFISLSESSGSTVAAGYGFPASASFANALWGDDSPIAGQESSLGVANALVSLAEGGQFVAFGNQIGKDTRVAFSWSQTQSPDMVANNGWATPNANAFGAGLSTHMTSFWTAGVNMGMLNEQSGLLGSTYDQNGPLNLGEQNRSVSMGVSSAFNLSDKSDLLIEATMVRSNGSSNSNSLISNVSPLYARSIGASLMERDAIDNGDHIQLSVKEPLRVISGNASLASSSVDANGNPITATQNVSLRPSGNEMDLAVSYQTPVQDSLQWNVSIEDRHDADNIAGVSEVVGLVGATYRF